MPMTTPLGTPIRHQSRGGSDDNNTSRTAGYESACLRADRQRSLVSSLDGVPDGRVTSRASLRSATDSLLSLLADVADLIAQVGADQVLEGDEGDALVERLVGTKPSAPVARAFRSGFEVGLEVVTDTKSWAYPRWKVLHEELGKLPARKAVARRTGTGGFPETKDAITRIARAARSRDGRDWQHAGATAATLVMALRTSQGIAPTGDGSAQRGTHVLRTGHAAQRTRVRKSGAVEVAPGHWIDESEVVWVDGRPKLKRDSSLQIKQYDVREKLL